MKKAFTLAEVLITLGIVGIVAALTLPALIHNYQKKVWVNSLKKDYSMVTNACRMMLATDGVDTLAETEFYKLMRSNYENEFKAEAKKYFQNANVKRGSLVRNSEILDMHPNHRPSVETKYTYRNGNTISSMWGIYTLILPDSAISFQGIENSIENSIENRDLLVVDVDVNGIDKQPNRNGDDLFEYYLDSDCKLKILANSDEDNCYLGNSPGQGHVGSINACFNSILQNGWEIKYDK